MDLSHLSSAPTATPSYTCLQSEVMSKWQWLEAMEGAEALTCTLGNDARTEPSHCPPPSAFPAVLLGSSPRQAYRKTRLHSRVDQRGAAEARGSARGALSS